MRNPRITKRLYRYGELLRNQLVTQKTPVEIFNVLEKSFYEAILEKINEIDLLASIIENEQILVLFQNESAAIAINRLINHMVEHGVYNSEGFNYILPSALGYALTDKKWQRVSQISFIHNMGLGSNDTWSQRNGSIETIFWSKISNTKDMIFLSQYFRFDLNSSKISHDKQFNAAYIKASRLATELPQGVNNDMPYNSYQALLALVELAKNRDFSNAIDGAIQLFRNPHVLKSSLNLYLVRKTLRTKVSMVSIM